jgi:hypothetical protein
MRGFVAKNNSFSLTKAHAGSLIWLNFVSNRYIRLSVPASEQHTAEKRSLLQQRQATGM